MPLHLCGNPQGVRARYVGGGSPDRPEGRAEAQAEQPGAAPKVHVRLLKCGFRTGANMGTDLHSSLAMPLIRAHGACTYHTCLSNIIKGVRMSSRMGEVMCPCEREGTALSGKRMRAK